MSALRIDEEFVKAVDKALDRCDNFLLADSPFDCRPFVVDGAVLGFVRKDCADILAKYESAFVVKPSTDAFPLGCVTVNPELTTPDQRTECVREVFEKIRDSGEFPPLKAWRNELYMVSPTFSAKPSFGVERSGAGLLGIKQYGAHMNGYVWAETENGREMRMWIARRALTKPTFPGQLDQIVAGGIGNSLGVRETIIKESEEEAGIPAEVCEKAKAVGCVSYVFESPARGVIPEIEYTFDLELPTSFSPVVIDGEVSEFYCWPVQEVCRHIVLGEFKPNCAIIILDFLIRHGFITADNFPNYETVVARLHRDISPAFVYQTILSMNRAKTH